MSKNKVTHLKKLQSGLAIYKTGNSQYWFAPILIPKTKKYVRKSSKEKSTNSGDSINAGNGKWKF